MVPESASRLRAGANEHDSMLRRPHGHLVSRPRTLEKSLKSDGIVVFPRGSQGKTAGQNVSVRLYRPRSDLEKTIFAIGSHDMTLDLIAQHLAQKGLRFASSNVGSLGGLMALRRDQAHLAGTHLLDPATGEYNIKFIKEYLPNTRVVVYSLVKREQGLIVKKNNPKNITSLFDLQRDDVQFINRQHGEVNQ